MSGRLSPEAVSRIRAIHTEEQLSAAYSNFLASNTTLGASMRAHLNYEIELGAALDALRRKSKAEYLASLQEAGFSEALGRDLRRVYRVYAWRKRRMSTKEDLS